LAEFCWPLRVYYEDTDCGGVVYHANYLRFCERARSEWLRALGFEQDELRRAHGIIFAVHALCADFLKPARFNDALAVSVRLTARGRASLTLAQAVTRGAELLMRAEVKIACVHAERLRPMALPEPLLAKLPHAD
jgi:acyl-CoA thioester hydrolase